MEPYHELVPNANVWSSESSNQNVPAPQFLPFWYHEQPAQTRSELVPAMLQSQNGESSNTSSSENRGPQEKRRKHNNPNWDAHQSELRQLYLDENKTLVETMQLMKERHNFIASNKLYKLQFKKWEWQKNLPATHSRFMVEKARKRKHEENKETVFRYGNQNWDRSKYATLARNKKNQTSPQAQDYPTPVGVSYKTPKPVDLTQIEEYHHSDESPAGSDGDVSDADAGVTMYPQGTTDESSDAEIFSDDEEEQTDDSDDVGIPLLRSQGYTREELLNLLNLARSYNQEGRVKEAEDSYLQASHALSHVIGRTHQETASVNYELANFYAQHKRTEDADAIIDIMTGDFVKDWGHEHDRTQKHILHTTELLETWGRSADALGILSHSWEIIEKLDRRGHRSTRRTQTPGRVTKSWALGPIPDLQQTIDKVRKQGSVATIDHGISVAKAHVNARNQASEGLLLAIIQHCKRHPQGLVLRRVQATAELLGLYSKLGTADEHRFHFVGAEDALTVIFNEYGWTKERFQSIELMEASMQLALNVFRGGFEIHAARMFGSVDEKAEWLFGYDDERTIWILITIGLAYQSNAGWDQASKWFEKAFSAALGSDQWDDEDGIVRALQNAIDKRHFSYLSDEGRPYKTIFGISGISIRPGRLHLS
ncbi:hypothetical protein BDP81DRAFT_475998 [Colletotrichum phormii]|uniref:Clr5 domain-containing protein n=1 Tax=Colletotrichum phormii TaxID=359342 RepID=A0AAJ0EAM8_9PEZI|nr:uncharacterized protein BDP81DRAFT_475998 [Colletotrichum phormii]KAK1622878.1 hypothetical protein BDP81DRAFT_475998 [Colletotrichum phormii]